MEHTIFDSPKPGAPDAAHDPFDDGRALQDRLPVHCFGCGTLNAHGLHIVEHGERKSVVACSVRQRPVQCATADVITVRVKGLGRHARDHLQ